MGQESILGLSWGWRVKVEMWGNDQGSFFWAFVEKRTTLFDQVFSAIEA